MAKDRGGDTRPEDEKLQDFVARLEDLTTTYLADTQVRLESGDDLTQNALGGLMFFDGVPTVPAVAGVIVGQMVNRAESVEKMGEYFPAFRDSSKSILQMMVFILPASYGQPEEAMDLVDGLVNHSAQSAIEIINKNPESKFELELGVATIRAMGEMYRRITPMVEQSMGRNRNK